MQKNRSVTENPKFAAKQTSWFKPISKQGLQCSMTLAMLCCTINNNNNNNNNNINDNDNINNNNFGTVKKGMVENIKKYQRELL